MSKKYVVAAALALGVVVMAETGIGAFAMAGTGAGTESRESAVRLDEVVVTATRSAESVDQSLAAVTVITRQQIEDGQFRSLAEVLSTVPGLQVSRSGGMGQATSVFMRGSSSRHTLVLLDGLRIGSAALGVTAFQHLPLGQIERIEVVRGPRSTLYGADAIGGVIQIFTRRGGDEQRGNVTVGGGSHSSHEARASLSGPLGDSHYSLALANRGTGGFDVRENNVPTGGWGRTPNEPDKDSLHESSASLRLGHRFTPGNELEVQALHAAGSTEFDGNPNETDFRQQTLGLTMRLRPVSFWDITLQGGQSRDDGKNFKDGRFFSNFNTKKNQLGWQNDFQLGDHQLLTLGIDYQEDQVASSTRYVRTSRATTGTYLQHQIDHGRNSLLLGLRHEDNQQFGSHDTYNLGYGLQLPNNLRLTANYGTAFRAPSFNQLYWPADPLWGGGGNPDLRPEESRSYELALQQAYGRGHWRVGIFRSDIDNLISGWPPININRARIDGLELENTYKLSETWQLSLALTLLSPKYRDRDRLLPRRSQRMGAVNLDGDFGYWRAGLTAQAFSHRYDNPANTIRVAGYTIFSLRAAYDLTDNWLLQGKIENLFDKKYQEVATFNTPGRGAFVTLSYNF